MAMKAGREGLLPKWVDLNGNPTFGQGGGTAPEVVELEVPSGSTSGTLTQEQLTKLQSNRETAIKFDGELYYLNDDKTSEGYLVYSHTGQDNTQNFFIKCITVTLSTLGWVLTSTKVGNPTMVLLWENPNPNTSFTNTSIDVDTTQYNGVYIEYYYSATYGAQPYHFPLYDLKVKLAHDSTNRIALKGQQLQLTDVSSEFIHILDRQIVITNNRISIGEGYYGEITFNQTSSPATSAQFMIRKDNSSIIPYRIYGIK